MALTTVTTMTEKKAGSWKSAAATCVVCFVVLLAWTPTADAGPVKEVKRSAIWKLPEEYKYESELTRPDSKHHTTGTDDDDDYSGLDKQKLVQLIAKLILERKGLVTAQRSDSNVFDDSIQPAKRQRSLFAGDRGGWGGGYGK